MSYNYSEEYRNYFYETNHTKTLLFCSYNMNISVVPGKGPKIENRYRWKSSKSYSVGDEATEGVRRYKCLIANSGNKPSASTTYWQDIGKDEPVIITNENIDKENFEYEMAFNSAKNLCIGSCESARIAIRIRNDGKIPPLVSHENDSYEESILNCYLYFDDNSSTLMYLGMFQCSKDEVTEDAKFRNIEMFDQMATLRDLDVYEWFTRFSAENPNYTMRQLRDGLFYVLNTDNEKYAYIKMPIDQKEQTLIHDNSTYKYDIDEGTTKLSAGNLLEDICEANGVWGRFARAFDENGRVLFEYITPPALRVPALASEGSAGEEYKIPKRDKITKNMRERYVKHDWYRTRPIGKISVYNAYSECLGAKAKGDLNIYDEGRTKKIGEKAEYAIYDNKFFDEVRDKGSLSNFETFLNDILDAVENISYEPYEVRCVGDLVREPGDPIFIEETDDDIDPSDPRKEYTSFKTYIFSRTLKGINVMKDTYKATGDRRMPVFGDSSSSSPYSSSSTNGVYTPSSSSRLIDDGSSYGSINVPELIRNFGFRLLEIQNADYVFDKDTGAVKIFWDDPADIITNEPVPASWAGTIVVRSTDPPLNRWSEGAVVLLDETTRNAHATEETAFVDDDCGEYNMVYYGIFPYDVKGDYNPFKILKVITNNVVKAPRIISILNILENSCDVSFTIPEGNFEYVKLVYKKNSKPGNVNDGTAVDITGSSAHITGLTASSKYYFKIFLKADNKAKSESNTVSVTTENVVIREVVNIDARRGNAYDTAGGKWPMEELSPNWQISNDWFVRINDNDFDGRAYMDYWGGGGWGDKNHNDFKNCKLCIEMKVKIRGNPTYGCYPMISFNRNGTSESADFVPAGFDTSYSYYDWNVCGKNSMGSGSALSDRGLTRCATKVMPLRDKTGEFVVRYEIDVRNNILGNGKIYVNGTLYDTLYVNNPKFLYPFYYDVQRLYDIASYRVQFGNNFDIQYVKVWGES